MIQHDFYKINEETYPSHAGAKFTVSKVSYCTNDSGCGVFTEDCLKQLTGNNQFQGGKEELQRWLNKSSKTYLFGNYKPFWCSEYYANQQCKQLNQMFPLRQLPIRQFEIGSKVSCMVDDNATVIGQEGKIVKLKCDDGYEFEQECFECWNA
jgi:hypothetical protein